MTTYGPGSVQTEPGTIDNTDTILIEGGDADMPAGAIVTYSGLLDNAGLVALTGGAVAAASGGTLAVTGTLDNTGSVDGAAAASVLSVATGGTLEDAGEITVEGRLVNAGSVVVEGGTVAYESGTGLIFTPAGTLVVGGTLINSGSIAVAVGLTSDYGMPGASGGVVVDSGTLANSGTLELDGSAASSEFGNGGGGGGSLFVTGLLDSTGALLIDAGGAAGGLGSASGGMAGVLTINASGTLESGGDLVIAGGLAGYGARPGGTGASAQDGGLLINSGSITVEGGTDGEDPGSSGTLMVGGSLTNSSVITILGDAAAVDPSLPPPEGGLLAVTGSISNSGSIVIAGGAGAINLLDQAGNGAELIDDGQLITSGDIQLQAGDAGGGTGVSAGAGGRGGELIVNGLLDNTGSVDVGASIVGGSAATLSVAAAGDLTDTGVITVEGSLDNAGSMVVTDGGRLALEAGGTFNSSGIVFVQDGSEIDLFASTGAGITFGDPGTLRLGPQISYTGTIADLSVGDRIQIDGQTIVGASIVGTTLFVDTSSGATETFAVAPGQTPYPITVGQGSDGDQDLLTVQCFTAGTRIATPDGEAAVETLRVGQLVATVDGGVQSARPIRWIGQRRIDPRTVPDPELVLPIRIRPDAFAPGVPLRDLLLSPDHAVRVGGVLVAVRQLANGATIVREPATSPIEYFHIELDRHALLLAEGLAAESYLDTGAATLLPRDGVPLLLHPHGAMARTQTGATCLPFATDAATVRPIWCRLAARAAALGYSPAVPAVSHRSGLHLLAGTRVLPPLRADDTGALFALPPGTATVQLASRAAVPAQLRPWLDDRRRLGVCIAGIRARAGVRVHDIALDDPALAAGWWAPERDGARCWRWTDGAACLALPPGADTLELRLGGCTEYSPTPAAAPHLRQAASAAASLGRVA